LNEKDDEDEVKDTAAIKAREDDWKKAVDKSLSKMKDPEVIELYVSIIDLIEYICKHSKDNKCFEQIAENLDEIRDEALFRCL
jgi:hypothetical protein